MKRFFQHLFLGLSLFGTACGGFTEIGKGGTGGLTAAGGGGNGNAGRATGGNGAGTAGSAAYQPCAGKPCGSQCSNCDPNDLNCAELAVVQYCDPGGRCGINFPVCGNAECQDSGDCAQPGAPCRECSDGSLACPVVECVQGRCVGSFPTCSTSTCRTDDDCPRSLAPCQLCADGTTACPWSRCENGSCTSGIDSCGATDPCAGKACGDQCSTCDPMLPCLPVLAYCDAELKCQLNQPVCDPNGGCRTDADCPGVGACPQCPDGNSCAELRCVAGACRFECGGGTCSAQGASCANGETCCSGLTCCSGVPVPQGQEYCGSVCPISDRNLKRDFASVDRDAILDKLAELPISTWTYKTESREERHIGPMAQDFMTTFGVGTSDRTILQVDADGVALAAIQALHARLKAVEEQNESLRRELDRRDARCGR